MAFLQRFALPRAVLLTRSLCASVQYDEAHFEKIVKNNKVVVFMKGVPEEPRCGFSNAVVRILEMHGVEGFDSHNVLEDDGLRNGMKEFTAWPTFPQVYFDGEFLGGCDILLEMHQKGDLVAELEKIGIRSALVDSKPEDST